MNHKIPLEIERKFIIRMPNKVFLKSGVTWEITQIYLIPDHEGENLRIRCAKCRGQEVYTMTSKVRQSDMTCYENEQVIDHAAFITLQAQARPDSAPVKKIRHAIPYNGHILEIDVYPFWEDYAVLEVELNDEEETFDLPPQVQVVREVTGDARYKNTNIARHLFAHPNEPLPVK